MTASSRVVRLRAWVGRRVVCALTNDHYLCGTVERVDAEQVHFRIGDHALAVAAAEVDTLRHASPHQADFFK